MEHGSASELRLGQKRRDSAQPLNCLKLHFEFVRLPLSVVGPRPTNEGLVVLGRHGRGSGQCHGPRCRRARRESSLTGFGFYSGFGIVGLFMLTLPWPRSRHLQWPRLLQHRLGLPRPACHRCSICPFDGRACHRCSLDGRACHRCPFDGRACHRCPFDGRACICLFDGRACICLCDGRACAR